jgi:hypothetical protein
MVQIASSVLGDNMRFLVNKLYLCSALSTPISSGVISGEVSYIFSAIVNLQYMIDANSRISYPLAKRLEVGYDGILGTGRMARRMGAN